MRSAAEHDSQDKVNLIMVATPPATLVSTEVVLRELDENLIKAESATEALQILLKNDVAIVLVDVCMPDLDGFELARMIREHPRFQSTAIIFISAIHLTDTDYLHGYEMGGVDYVPVPIVPELLRAKVKVFSELYRKSRQLAKLNQELEQRVAERTAEVESAAALLRESERRRIQHAIVARYVVGLQLVDQCIAVRVIVGIDIGTQQIALGSDGRRVHGRCPAPQVYVVRP